MLEDYAAAELIQRLAFALAIGLLIGLERGWRTRDEEEGERAAGVRTHGLAALLGGVWGAVSLQFEQHGGAVALGIAFALFSGVMAVFRYRETLHDKTYGATSIVAAMLAFALGAYAVVGDQTAAAAGAVATTTLLAAKGMLHEWLQKLTWAELRSGLVLLVMTFILLPLLPDRAIDRWGAVNPHELWLMTVLIAAISFAGYVAVKVVGDRRGLAIAGMAGGLASSTAATAAMSRLAAERPARVQALAAGALFSNAVMGLRLLVILSVVNVHLGLRLAAPLLAVALAYLAFGAFFVWRGDETGETDGQPLAGENPLDLPSVLKFGALLAAVMALSKIATKFAGSSGAYALALVSGVADVDAISLTMARLGASEIGADAAAYAILLAIVSNTVAKSAMSWLIGGAPMGLRFSLASLTALGAAGAALVFLPTPPGA